MNDADPAANDRVWLELAAGRGSSVPLVEVNRRIAEMDRLRAQRDLDDLRDDLAIDPAAVPVRRETAATGLHATIGRVAPECGVDPARAHETAGSRDWQERIAASDARAASHVVAASAAEFVARNRATLLASGMTPQQIEAGLRDGSIERQLRALGAIR